MRVIGSTLVMVSLLSKSIDPLFESIFRPLVHAQIESVPVANAKIATTGWLL